MKSPLRIGIIGAGEVAERHVAGLLRAGSVEIAAVAETDAARRTAFARQHGVGRATADYRLLLSAPEVDAVLLLTPHHLHRPMALESFEAGKDVICEKPMAPTVEDCDLMLDAAARRGRALFVTHTLRHDFFFEAASRRLREGALGKPLAASFRWFTDERRRLEAAGHWKGTRERSGGGVLIDGGPHAADVANALFGRAVRVIAFGAKLDTQRAEVAEDTAAFAVEYAGGVLATFLLSFTAGAAFAAAEGFAAGIAVDLFASEGHIEGGFLVRDGRFRRFWTEHRRGAEDRSAADETDDWTGAVDTAIVRALRGEAAPPVTALEARNAIAVVEAAYQALASGRSVDVDWR
jgi:predicted dehydrogenase